MKNIKFAISHPPNPFKETVVDKVGKFLKERANRSFTVKDISLNLKLKPKSVSSALSRLKLGRNKTGIINGRKRILKKKNGKNRKTSYKGFKIGTVRNSEKGKWEYFQKTKFKAWKVDFKLIETNSKNKKKHRWDESGNMDLSGYATGIVPSDVDKSKIIDVAATELFRKALDIMQHEGVSLWNAVSEDDSKTVYLGAELINENPLDTKYNSRWDGQVTFVNDMGNSYPPFDVHFSIDMNEYY